VENGTKFLACFSAGGSNRYKSAASNGFKVDSNRGSFMPPPSFRSHHFI